MSAVGRQSVVLLGASNLTLSFPLVLRLLRECFPGGVDVFAAHGHGRSFGISNTVLTRVLPGITASQLWHELDARESLHTRPCALITDIGNDVMYGITVPQILDWLRECLEPLAARQAHITLTQIPVQTLYGLGRLRYRLAKSLLFPSAELTWEELRPVVDELSAGVHMLAEQFEATLVTPDPEWYGLDPIHIRRSARVAAWRRIVSGWPVIDVVPASLRPGVFERIRVWQLRPAERTVFGRQQRCSQPVYQSDGLTLHLY